MIRCLLILLPVLLVSACSHRMGGTQTVAVDGTRTTTWYSHTTLGEDADAVSGGADAFAVIKKNQTKSFGRATTGLTTYGIASLAADVSKAEVGRDTTAIKEGAATDRTGIVEGAQTERLRETETTKRILEGAGG